ncbi:hypothetical protein B0H17DRAFT_1132841 [Mycena rosella]|uniref:Core-binding (CB) domain-containing protein n=1 Tax=Mycena rosella TaxID=1033263 RepID=A0AAD7GL19_MYCRO|nr:hypothetical protein B0H17DRAFT_1132841 [Mycena rosella]
MQHAIQHAWADSTLRKYGNSVARYILFCENEGIEKGKQLPASEFLLCAFAASRVGEVAGVTARGAIATVKAWHIVSSAPWHGGLRLRYALHGVENLAPTDSKQPERPPVTATMLDILEEELDHNDPKDAAVFSACCAFWGQIRLGEILSTAQETVYESGLTQTQAPVDEDEGRQRRRGNALPPERSLRSHSRCREPPQYQRHPARHAAFLLPKQERRLDRHNNTKIFTLSGPCWVAVLRPRCAFGRDAPSAWWVSPAARTPTELADPAAEAEPASSSPTRAESS